MPNAQHRIGNSGANSSKLNICNSIGHLCKYWADDFQYRHIAKPLTVSGHCKVSPCKKVQQKNKQLYIHQKIKMLRGIATLNFNTKNNHELFSRF
jgi:hypothetical protein